MRNAMAGAKIDNVQLIRQLSDRLALHSSADITATIKTWKHGKNTILYPCSVYSLYKYSL